MHIYEFGRSKKKMAEPLLLGVASEGGFLGCARAILNFAESVQNLLMLIFEFGRSKKKMAEPLLLGVASEGAF